MSKLLVAALIIGVAVVSSVGTVAAAHYLPWTENIYSVSDSEHADDGDYHHTVSTFEDSGNKCYVVNSRKDWPDSAPSISCVRMR